LGNMLLIGPQTIFPASGDRHMYLEAAVSIQWHSETFGHWRSVRIYCDANGSDEEGYLEPMVRFAAWHREKVVLVTRPPWPSVTIELLKLPVDSSDLQIGIRKLQEVMGQVPFPPQGLPIRRNFGACPGDDTGHFTIQVGCGWQQMERSAHVAEAPAFYDVAAALEGDLRRLAIPVERSAWSEHYELSPDEMLQSKGWYWDGQPVPF